MSHPPLFEEDFPEVRAYIRTQLTRVAFGKPHTKRALGEGAVRDLLSECRIPAGLQPTVRELTIRGAMQIAGEELRRVRVRLKELPPISAFYAIVETTEDGRRLYLQAPALGMTLAQAQRVWRRIVKQRDRSDEVAAVWGAFIGLPTWQQGAQTVAEACRLAGLSVEVFTDDAAAQ